MLPTWQCNALLHRQVLHSWLEILAWNGLLCSPREQVGRLRESPAALQSSGTLKAGRTPMNDGSV